MPARLVHVVVAVAVPVLVVLAAQPARDAVDPRVVQQRAQVGGVVEERCDRETRLPFVLAAAVRGDELLERRRDGLDLVREQALSARARSIIC